MSKLPNFGELLGENRTPEGELLRSTAQARADFMRFAEERRRVVLFLLESLDKITLDILDGAIQPTITIPEDIANVGFFPNVPAILKPEFIPLWQWFCSVINIQGMQIDWDYPELDKFWVIPQK